MSLFSFDDDGFLEDSAFAALRPAVAHNTLLCTSPTVFEGNSCVGSFIQ